MNRRMMAAIAALALVATGTVAAVIFFSYEGKSPTRKDVRAQQGTSKPFIAPATYVAPPPETPSSTPKPYSCGPWSNQYVAGTAAAAIAERYGLINYCFLSGNTWVITALGKPGVNGVIALYPCTDGDQACLNNQSDHPLSGWKFIAPPYPGGVVVLGGNLGDNTLIVDVGGHQIGFDVTTGTFPNP